MLELAVTLRNAGFGELFNPRNLEVTLSGPGGTLAAVLPEDPRRWAGGTATGLSFRLSVPADLAEGAYAVGLRLADADSALARDPRYSVRFANAGVWDSASGINVLKKGLIVSLRAPGARNPAFTAFGPLEGPAALRAMRKTGRIIRAWSWPPRGKGPARDPQGRRLGP